MQNHIIISLNFHKPLQLSYISNPFPPSLLCDDFECHQTISRNSTMKALCLSVCSSVSLQLQGAQWQSEHNLQLKCCLSVWWTQLWAAEHRTRWVTGWLTAGQSYMSHKHYNVDTFFSMWVSGIFRMKNSK